jgi:hypothetical protein
VLVREGTPRLVHLYLASLDSFLNSTDLHNASRWTLTVLDRLMYILTAKSDGSRWVRDGRAEGRC